MAVVCPTVLASSQEEFARQIKTVSPFAKRIQIDLMDGVFAMSSSIPLDKVWWPHSMHTDIHLMYARPNEHLQKLVELKPSLVIIHAEAKINHMLFAAELHKEGINAGLAVLADTPISEVKDILHSFDHLLIFSGDLGKFGGEADLDLLEKVRDVREINPEIELGWDGGINADVARKLVDGGVDVLNVGGYIQKSDDPPQAYTTLVETVS